MNKNQRNKKIFHLFEEGLTFTEIADEVDISRQRVHQLVMGYQSPSNTTIPAINHKILTSVKRRAIGLPDINMAKLGLSGGRDYVRELVRIRDNRTCQICSKKWKPTQRRFDVHHLDEKREGSDNNNLRQGNLRWDRNNLDRMVTLCHKCHLNLDIVRNKMSRMRK